MFICISAFILISISVFMFVFMFVLHIIYMNKY